MILFAISYFVVGVWFSAQWFREEGGILEFLGKWGAFFVSLLIIIFWPIYLLIILKLKEYEPQEEIKRSKKTS